MSEKSDNDWPTVKKDFLTQAGKLPTTAESANKFQVQQGQVQETQDKDQRTEVVDKANRIKEGHRFKGWEWRLLSDAERDLVKAKQKAKRKEKQKAQRALAGDPNRAGGGLPSQYKTQFGTFYLPPGTSIPEGTYFSPDVPTNPNVPGNPPYNVNNANAHGTQTEAAPRNGTIASTADRTVSKKIDSKSAK